MFSILEKNHIAKRISGGSMIVRLYIVLEISRDDARDALNWAKHKEFYSFEIEISPFRLK